MPTQGISVYFTIQDGGSSTLKAIGDQTKSLDKETQSLAQAYAALESANKPLISRQSELKIALEKSAATVRDAKKAYHELGDEASERKMTEAIAEQDALKRELKDVESQLKSNQSTLNSYRENLRKSSVEGDGIGSTGSGGTSILSTLGQADLWKALGSTASELGGMFVSSAFGSEGSTMFSSILGTAGTGAAIGSMIAPGIGTAVGAALGGVVGAITGQAQIAQAKDDAFIEYYNGLYEDVTSATSSTLTSGTTLAAGRERDLTALTSILDSDDQLAKDFQQSLIEMGRTPPFSYDTVTALSKEMLGLGLDHDEVTQRINSLADAAAALDLSESSVTSIVSYLESSQLAGAMESRVVKSLSKMGINVYEALADAFDISESEVADKLSDLDVDQAIQAIYDYMSSRFSGAASGMVDTYEGAQGILDSYTEDMAAAMGAGYNETRIGGLQSQINALEGPLGDAMGEINAIIGQNKAYLDNLNEQYQRETLAAVLLGETSNLFSEDQQEVLNGMHQQYEEWAAKYEEGNEEAGLQMQSLYEQAQALATAYYESSGAYQAMQDVELDQIAAIRENTVGLAAATNAYRLAQEQGKGAASTIRYNQIVADEELAYWDAEGQKAIENALSGNSFAYGLDRVPYDDFPALLHRDERVLTAQAARAQDAAGGNPTIQISITGNNFTGSTVEMAGELAEIIARELERAAVIAVPR